MLLRPGPDILQAGDERMAGASLVEVLNVHHFEAGLVHLMLWIKVRICRQTRCCDSLHDGWMSESATLGVGKDVDLHLSHAAGELISQGA